MNYAGKFPLLFVASLLLLNVSSGEIDPFRLGPESTLTFTATQAGARFTGRFAAFDTQIAFDPEALAESRFEVRVVTASVNTDYGERDEILRAAEFLDVQAFPEAVFSARNFQERGPHEFVADGMLKIKGAERPLQLAFRFSHVPDSAGQWQLTGSFEINRLDFGVGLGEWRDPKWVGHEVTVSFRLILDSERELTGG